MMIQYYFYALDVRFSWKKSSLINIYIYVQQYCKSDETAGEQSAQAVCVCCEVQSCSEKDVHAGANIYMRTWQLLTTLQQVPAEQRDSDHTRVWGNR